jgi:predicted metal-binding protein
MTVFSLIKSALYLLKNFAVEELEIQPVGCLWVCARGCVVTVSTPDKPTYLLVDLPPDEENASALQLILFHFNNDTNTLVGAWHCHALTINLYVSEFS